MGVFKEFLEEIIKQAFDPGLGIFKVTFLQLINNRSLILLRQTQTVVCIHHLPVDVMKII